MGLSPGRDERLRAPDQQNVCSSPGLADTCVLEQGTFSFGWDFKAVKVPCTRIDSERKRTRNTYRGRVGVNPCVSGSHSKHPCLQVSSGLRATVTKFTYEASLVLIDVI